MSNKRKESIMPKIADDIHSIINELTENNFTNLDISMLLLGTFLSYCTSAYIEPEKLFQRVYKEYKDNNYDKTPS